MTTTMPIKQHRNQHDYRRNQQGAVLAISLIVLVLITLIGISSFRTSVTQTLMSTNSQLAIITFNDAETAIIQAEEAIDTKVNEPGLFDLNTENDGYYDLNDVVDVYNIDWDDDTKVETTAEGDKYIVHYRGKQEIPGENEVQTNDHLVTTGSHVYSFVITARSTSLKGTQRVVQSVYITNEMP
ncbi:PilX N-terminal domain-containing pilus assembly protein [Thalassotalea aquiviva]|uniref:pilus assembly PilX family protein n=1 Tax=Thalassotalea aquiviva TaxID=3242415 RepID=UPI00352A2AFE